MHSPTGQQLSGTESSAHGSPSHVLMAQHLPVHSGAWARLGPGPLSISLGPNGPSFTGQLQCLQPVAQLQGEHAVPLKENLTEALGGAGLASDLALGWLHSPLLLQTSACPVPCVRWALPLLSALPCSS